MKPVTRRVTIFIIFSLLYFLPAHYAAQQNSGNYPTTKELNSVMRGIQQSNSSISKIHKLTESEGGIDVLLLEIGPETGSKTKSLPAVFVAANMDGTVPISSEAAVFLAKEIASDETVRKDLTWYILASGNPDAAGRYFAKPLFKDARNDRAFNDDKDELIDEDGFDDLNGDGMITKMRVKDPAGSYIPVESDPRMMRRADKSKGEKGIYKIYTEGIDNDSEGKYNEDPPGGVNINVNFPHLFKSFGKTSGAWPGSENESYAIMEFIYDHPEIAAVFAYGSVNWCIAPPKGGRKGAADLSNIKIPKRWAGRLGADPEKSYSMKEVMEMAQKMAPPGMTLTESMVASFLGLGAVVNPLSDDLKFYKKLSEQYKEFLKKRKLDSKRLDSTPAKDGSFELWSYYHLGVPTFAMDFWTLPKVEKKKKDENGLTLDNLEKMSPDEFVGLGEEKIAAFMKEIGAPERFKPSMVINMVKSGKMTPEKIAGMVKKMGGQKSKKNAGDGDEKTKSLLAFSDKVLGGKGFVDWKEFDHPTLGKVEIGGEVPFTENTPPLYMIDSLLSAQVPWTFEIIKKLPRLKFLKSKVTAKGAGVFNVDLWIENTGYLPFPTAMGRRDENPAPAVVEFESGSVKFLSGKKRTPVRSLDGNSVKELSWIIQAEDDIGIPVRLPSKNVWNDSINISLGGK